MSFLWSDLLRLASSHLDTKGAQVLREERRKEGEGQRLTA